MIRTGREMRWGRAKGAAALALAAGLLAGCGGNGLAGGLRAAGVGDSPDEFLVLPTRPLEMPENLSALPPPAPGAPNRVDVRPEVEAVAALTGRPAAAGVADAGALTARAGPAAANIRATLAAEDALYRERNRGRPLDRLANRDTEARVYRDMRLDANAEFERLRALGLRVPAAPPLVE